MAIVRIAEESESAALWCVRPAKHPEDALAHFPVNPHRLDPYKSFKFRVKWDGRYVAGISKVSPLKRTTEVIRFREGGAPSGSRKSRGRTEREPITLERGVTHDPEFERWANLAFNRAGDAAMSPKNFRKDLVIELLNEQGNVVLAYRVYRAWVSEYVALPELDANGAAVAIESIRLEHEGWERDPDVKEPAET